MQTNVHHLNKIKLCPRYNKEEQTLNVNDMTVSWSLHTR